MATSTATASRKTPLRTEALAAVGLRVIRFRNERAQDQRAVVIDDIVVAMDSGVAASPVASSPRREWVLKREPMSPPFGAVAATSGFSSRSSSRGKQMSPPLGAVAATSEFSSRSSSRGEQMSPPFGAVAAPEGGEERERSERGREAPRTPHPSEVTGRRCVPVKRRFEARSSCGLSGCRTRLLATRIEDFITRYNVNAHPFNGTFRSAAKVMAWAEPHPEATAA